MDLFDGGARTLCGEQAEGDDLRSTNPFPDRGPIPQKLGSLRQRVVVREGDPRSVADLQDILPGHDAVISTLGPAGVGPTTILRAAAESTVAAMQAAAARRLLVVSAAVLFDDLGLAGKILRRTLLRNVGDDSLEMERIVTASALDWTHHHDLYGC